MSEEEAKTDRPPAPEAPPPKRFAWQVRDANHVFVTLSCDLCGDSSKRQLRGLDFGQIRRYYEKHRACALPPEETPEKPA
jgi:hypothetical protein